MKRTWLLALLTTTPALAQINAGTLAPAADKPFAVTKVAPFATPWRIAFLPDGRMLVTEKPGHMFLVTQKGEKTPIDGVPEVAAGVLVREAEQVWRDWNPLGWGVIRYRGLMDRPEPAAGTPDAQLESLPTIPRKRRLFAELMALHRRYTRA